MSEYQYYEFQAVDRLLDTTARAKLRAISSRARITASSFVNHYDYGDLKADPLQLLETYFDLFLYLANWGTRQFAMKLPKRFVDVEAIEACGFEEDLVVLHVTGEHVIFDMVRDDIEAEEWDDGSGRLAALAPLRGELLAGDLRLLALLWLIQVENGSVEDDAIEPAPGIGSLTPSLAALAEFLWIDPDLVEAAAGSAVADAAPAPSANEIEAFVRALPENEKIALLLRLHAGDAHVGADLRRRCRAPAAQSATVQRYRTAGELRAAARRIEQERRRVAEEKAAAELRRREQEAARARAQRMKMLAGREEQAWHEAETLISQRNAKGYDQATTLLTDLGELFR